MVVGRRSLEWENELGMANFHCKFREMKNYLNLTILMILKAAKDKATIWLGLPT